MVLDDNVSYGYYNVMTNTITMNPNGDIDVLVHEMRHACGDRMGEMVKITGGQQ
jgi:hypothetical protein